MAIDASNRRTLKVAFVLSSVFAISQLAAAAASRSLALLGDCILMLLDSASYVVNWRAEAPGIAPHRAAAVRVRAASVSVAVLVGTTIFIVVVAAGRLREDAALYGRCGAPETSLSFPFSPFPFSVFLLLVLLFLVALPHGRSLMCPTL